MQGDAQYARGFTMLLYAFGIFHFAIMSFGRLSPGTWESTNLAVLMPEPGRMSPVWTCLAALVLVVAVIRSWGVPSAWWATFVLCVFLFFWFPFGTLAAWTWFRSLRDVERPLTG